MKKKKNQVITTIFTPVLNRNKALEFGYRKLGGNVLGKVALKKGANAQFLKSKGKFCTKKMALIYARREKGDWQNHKYVSCVLFCIQDWLVSA